MTATSASEVLGVVHGVGGGTDRARGEELFEFVHSNRFQRCLELGFAHGVSTTYIAAALEANGEGSLTSVDIPSALEREPTATELLERAGLTHRVSLEIDPDSYVWWLHRQLRAQLRDRRIEPVYDFVFLDGAHTWDVDALAFTVVDRLLMPGGWLLLDDLNWMPDSPATSNVPDNTRALAHVGEIWALLIEPDAKYDELRTDGRWGYARKSSTREPTVRTVVKHDLVRQVRNLVRFGESAITRAR